MKKLQLIFIFLLLIFNINFSKACENITFKEDNGIYVIKLRKNKFKIEPYVSKSLESINSIDKKDILVAINAGFFDPKNAETISYIIQNYKTVANPEFNNALINNENLQPYIDKILNRSEFRVLNCYGETKYEISNHYNTPPQGCNIEHSIQGGPELSPTLNLEKEAFTAYENGKLIRHSAGVLYKHARTAIGMDDNNIYIVITSTSSPMTIQELSSYLKNLGVKSAMAFDGGSSTSLYINIPKYNKLTVTSAKDDGSRKVKSFLLVKPN